MGDIKTTDYVSEYKFKKTEYEPKLDEFEFKPTEAARKDPGEFELYSFDPEPKKTSGIRTADGKTKPVDQIKEPGNQTKKPAGSQSKSDKPSEKPEGKDGKKKPGKDKRTGKETGKKSGKVSNAGGKAKRTVGKAFRPVAAAKENLQASAEGMTGTDDPGDSSWDYAAMNARTGKGMKQGFQEVIKILVKIVKVVASTALLPVILIMAAVSIIVVAVISLFEADSSSKSTYGEDGTIIGNSQEQQMVKEYKVLMDYFEGQEIPVMAIMCSIYRESNFYGNNLENTANNLWNVTDEEYTDAINSGELSRDDFDGHMWKGQHYLYWSKKYQDWKEGSCGYGIVGFTSDKGELYDYALQWFSAGEGAGSDFDISDVTMQTNFVLYQLDYDPYFRGLKDDIVRCRSIEEASIMWVERYEKPASDWEESGKSRAQNASWIKAKVEALTSMADFGGKFAWPLPAAYTRITSPFGNRTAPTAGASTNHKGIDIGAPEGTPVYASASGRVVTVDYNSARGYYITVEHSDGFKTLYQHLSQQLVKVNDYVETGQQIAVSGNTGITAGPHLHFEIWINGTAVDPAPYLGR